MRYLLLICFILVGCTKVDFISEEVKDTITVSIDGMVEFPNSFVLEKGSTLEDLLKEAIPLANADLSSLDMEMPLYEGDTIFVREVGKKCIYINSASLEELMEITGVGEKTAQAIIEYRNTYGIFKTMEELMNIRGIGEKKLAKMRDEICI